MIRVTVELWPGGRKADAEQIGSMSIWREHPAILAQSSYGARFQTHGNLTDVAGVKHWRDEDVFALIARVLAAR